MLPAMLAPKGYTSHHIGKWHQGLYLDAYTPMRRGFDSSFGFLVGGEDHMTQDASWSVKCKVLDLWNMSAPAYGRNGEWL